MEKMGKKKRWGRKWVMGRKVTGKSDGRGRRALGGNKKDNKRQEGRREEGGRGREIQGTAQHVSQQSRKQTDGEHRGEMAN